jgi:LacI family transcriptional regulator
MRNGYYMAATIKDVAKLAGVSTATVSYVVNGTRFVSEDTCQKVKRAMAKLEYYPSAVARSLRLQRTRTVGLIIPSLSNPSYTGAAHGVEEIMQQNGYSLIIGESGDNPQRERNLIQTFNSLLVDGLIMAPCDHRHSELKDVLRGTYPTVFLDRRLQGFQGDSVTLDNFTSIRDATRHLLGMGRKRIALILGPEWYSTTRDRIEGYRKAHEEAGLTPDPTLTRYGNFELDAGLALSEELFRASKPDAVIAASSGMTLGAFLKAKEMGLSIPGRIAIIGCDDLAWANATKPPLTMIFQPTSAMGKKSAELLLKRIENATDEFETIFLPTKMILRGST